MCGVSSSFLHDVLIVVKHTVLLHDAQELDDDLGRRTDENLTLASLLGVVDGVERIVEDGSLDHFDGIEGEILKRRCLLRYEVSVEKGKKRETR